MVIYFLISIVFLAIIAACVKTPVIKDSSFKTEIVTEKNEFKKISIDLIPLSERGWDKETRESYISSLGNDFYSKDIEEAFLGGRVYYGMKRIMVHMIHGYPNVIKNSRWLYKGSGGETLLEVLFEGEFVSDMTYSY